MALGVSSSLSWTTRSLASQPRSCCCRPLLPALRQHGPQRFSDAVTTNTPTKVSALRGGDGAPEDLLDTPCPVPRDQQPFHEFHELQRSFLFDWATLPTPQFALRIAGVFAMFFLFIGLPVSAVTFSQSDELLQCLAASSIGSGFITLVLLLRLYLGYNHVASRLLSATIVYEESGWYDGQTWVKPPQMLMRDRLLGSYQVKPTLEKLKRMLLGVSGAIVAAILVLVSAPPPKVYSATGSDYSFPSSSSYSQPSTTTSYEESVSTYEPWGAVDGGAESSGDSVGQMNMLQHMRRPGAAAPSL